MAVIGTDTHRSDPLSNLSMTNNGMFSAMERIREYSKHVLLLGGGGYEPRTSARGWGRMWGAANRIGSLPDWLLLMGGRFLEGSGMDSGSIVDMNYVVSGQAKTEMLEELDKVIAFHEEHTLPRIRSRFES